MRSTLITILMALLASSAGAADPSIEERLTRLEREVAALRAENEALRKQLAPASVPADASQPAAALPAPSATASSRLEIGGLLQAQAEGGGQPDSRFAGAESRLFVRRARVTAQSRLPHDTEVRVELDLAGSLSPASGLRAQLTDGYVTWSGSRLASVRAGQFKTPFGHEQLVSDPRLLTPERGLASDRLTPGRQLGAQLSGNIAAGRLTYSLGAFNGNGTNRNDNDDSAFLTAARVTGVLFSNDSLRVTAGVNGYRSRDRAVALPSDFGVDSTPQTSSADGVFAGLRRGGGIDWQLASGPAEVWAEYLVTRFEPQDAVPSRRFVARGWSVLGAWMLVPDRLQAVGRLERFDPSDRAANDASRLWSAGANWLLKGNDLKLQLFYMRGRTAGEAEGRVVARVQTVF